MGCFDFDWLLRMLKYKGYELILYPSDGDEVHIQLMDLDRDTGCAVNVKKNSFIKRLCFM